MTKDEIKTTATDATLGGLVEEWFKMQCENVWEVFYLYHLPSRPGIAGEITIASDEHPPPQGFVLSHPIRISGGWTRTQVCRHIFEIWRKLPVLAY